PKQSKQPRIHLNKRQHTELVLLTGILSILMALIASYFGVLQNGARLIMYLYLPMFLGAGTIGLFGICKTRLFQYKDWWQWIIFYNTASVCLTFFFSIFMIIIELAEIIGTTS
ncbi:MAG TPA: hypothetical protein PKB02_09040, partial [Anaerohalosphaeraceae bacterium]|nr:hypothetical protein [Anaerohalosphaeraceae bacterium]